MNETFAEIPLDARLRDATDEYSFVLKPSAAGGVGVFATHGIAKGTRLGLFPVGETRVYSPQELQRDPRLRQFCEFYGVHTSEGTFVASNFGCMSVGWYLNHSEAPNAHHDPNWEYFASRDIVAGEEVTIDYRVL